MRVQVLKIKKNMIKTYKPSESRNSDKTKKPVRFSRNKNTSVAKSPKRNFQATKNININTNISKNTNTNANANANTNTNTNKNKNTNTAKDKLRIMVLGGLEEVGRNMTLLEYGNDIIIIDMGLQFPEEDMPGIDYIIPNTGYLEDKLDRIRGVIITQ